MPEPMDMAEYISLTRRFVEPRLDDIPLPLGQTALPVLGQWSPDLERAISLYIILNVVRTQFHKTEDKFKQVKDGLNDADHYELKRVMTLIEDLID